MRQHGESISDPLRRGVVDDERGGGADQPFTRGHIICDVFSREIRMGFVGDSFVAGVGDPAHLGWVGRLAARAETRSVVVTGYNLGIRLNTSDDVRIRWQQVRFRSPDGLAHRPSGRSTD